MQTPQNNNGDPSHQQLQDMQRFQQFQQYRQQQQQPYGATGMGNALTGMMPQQQQPASVMGMSSFNTGSNAMGGSAMQSNYGNVNSGNTFAPGNWNNTSQPVPAFPDNNLYGTSNMDSSNGGSGARMMAMGGMAAFPSEVANSALANAATSSSALQNMQALLLKQQQQQQQQTNRPPQQRPMVMASGIPTTFNNATAQPFSTPQNSGNPQQLLLFQQQLAALQKQQMAGGGGSVAANAAMVAMQQQMNITNPSSINAPSNSNDAFAQQQNLLRQQQQLQQMQQMRNHPPEDSNRHATQPHRTSGAMAQMSGTAANMKLMQPPLPHMMQQQMGNSGNNSNDMMGAANNNYATQSGMMGQGFASVPHREHALGNNGFHDEAEQQQQQISSEQMSFLDGRFAGGWQSNADLPERRRVIFSILEVIRQMRPDTTKLSNKLPHMAKSLEEHLYRSAKSKEEYMDVTTLKNRLQAIAHGLEVHRSNDSTTTGQHSMKNPTPAGTQGGSMGPNSNWSIASALGSNSGMSGLGGLLSQIDPGQMPSASNAPPIANMGHPGTAMHQRNMSATENYSSSSAVQPTSLSAGSDRWSSGPDSNTSQSMGLDQRHGRPFSTSHDPTVGTADPSSSTFPFQDSFSGHSGLSNVASSYPSNSVPSDPNSHHTNKPSWDVGSGGIGASSNEGDPTATNTSDFSNSSKFQDPTAAQKMRVILQQQQRLLLLRHASKCTAGPQCTTKFCEQMVTLWKHMRTCRDKSCKTSHCLSSRCVLNHYRICKSNGRTLTCEVCGPVMLKIKQQERDDGTSDDPLTRDQEMSPSEQPSTYTPAMNSSAMFPQASSSASAANQSQLSQVQANHSRLKAQLDILKLLQKQQEQLLEQQRSLEAQAQNISDPNSAQFLQLQEQQLLLQQLQKRCQQQQLLVQHELQMQTTNIPEDPNQMNVATDPLEPSGGNMHISEVMNVNVQNSSEPSTANQNRMGFGGKRQGKSLVLPPSRKSKATGSDGSKNPAAKKAKVASKQKSLRSLKPDTDTATSLKGVDGDHVSVLSCMSTSEINKHLESLNKQIILSSRTVTHKCRPILQELLDDPFGWVFHDAVDPVALGLPDYFDVIKNPMHMDLVRKKLENAIYSDMESFARDMRLVFQNAILYNGESSEVGELAQSMMSRFDTLYNAVVADIENSHLNLESQGELCSLCGVQKRRYEPTVLYCQGKCGMQRIKRNAAYFTDRTKQNHWCEPCFNLLDPEKLIPLDDGSEVMKKDLQEFKNDALPEEGWVNCDTCQSWVHQVCALFNGRTNKSNARFTCPTCYINVPTSEESREKARKIVKGAEDLPRCKMSDALEKGLHDALRAAYVTRSNELGVDIEDVEKSEGLCVRVLSNVEKKSVVGEKMLQRYMDKGYPSEFPLRSKCIALFQRIHGVDTLLFALYVYEYGDECPLPNRRLVYISYLDSVRYFEPKCYRTTAYHSIMVEYLRYVKKRGFHSAYIWSCPPVGGDDYIFYCHPKHQLVPREDMLRSWYHKMLDQAKAQGIVIRTSTLYDDFFTNDGGDVDPRDVRDPTCLPYFEGDYIPGEIEIIIQQLEDSGESAVVSSSLDNVMVRLGHHLNKMKDNFIVVQLRSRRFIDAVQGGQDVSNWKEDSDDEVIRSKRAKISSKSASESYSPKMQSSGSVAISELEKVGSFEGVTAPSEFEGIGSSSLQIPTVSSTLGNEDGTADESAPAQTSEVAESLVRLDAEQIASVGEVASDTIQESVRPSSPPAEESNKQAVDSIPEITTVALEDQPSLDDIEVSSGTDPDDRVSSQEVVVIIPKEEGIVVAADCESSHVIDIPFSKDSVEAIHPVTELTDIKESDGLREAPEQAFSEDQGKCDTHTNTLTFRESSDASSNKRVLDEIKPAIESHLSGRNGVAVADTTDDDPPMDNEMFESRQQFLNYCQATHCQFDELRRAKHSTVMVLFQLHNPSAPKFLQQCGACYRDITHGIRYHCNDCSNFDLCDDCYEPVVTGLWAKRDPRFAHDERHSFSPIDMETTEESQKSISDRLKSLKAHVELLEHAGVCEGPPTCSLHNCDRLKKLFLHVPSCDVKPKRDCKICTRLLVLCTMHARLCNSRGNCPIPFCDRIRERNKRLRRQQQLMDDRRRQAQNELYHAGGEI